MGAFFDAQNKKTDSVAEKKTAEAPAAAPAAASPAYSGPELDGVTEPEAAVIMALVSHESGIELNRLKFNSIRFKEEIKK